MRPSGSTYKTFLDTNLDMRTMADIYSDLEFSGPPSSTYTPSSLDELASRIHAGWNAEGLTSPLYNYQCETVAAMLLRERADVTIPDPLYTCVTGIDGARVYLQPSTMELLRERPTVAQPRGGILCEELGTGKTVMVLALVLSTIDQLPKPEQSIYTPTILTPISFRHFRDDEDRASRERARWKKSTGEFPSLVEILHHYLRVNPEKTRSRLRDLLSEDNPGLLDSIERNVPYYLHYNDEAERARSSRGGRTVASPRVIYLTSATLIVVPPNLVAQWVSEIHKHVSSDIRVLVIRQHDDLPPALSLATEFDIVLTSHTRLAKERDGFNVDRLHTWKLCTCPAPARSPRAPLCNCSPAKGVSILAQIRWKRVVVDEGHGQGVPDTSFSAVCAKLNAERRWIMSGTPTRTLLGLNLGSSTYEDLQLLYPDSEENTPASSPSGQTLQLSDESESPSSIRFPVSDNAPPHTLDAMSAKPSDGPTSITVFRKIWDKYSREDLRRLHVMMSNFLRDPRFLADSHIFRTHVLQALFTPTGPLPGAIKVLEQLMTSFMIRHRIQDVEKDIELPSLTEETVVLDMDPLVRTSYNAMLAAITFNAIDSERTDKDYMFHAANVASVREVISNMSQLMFWRVDDNMYNVEELYRACEPTLQRATERGVSAADMELLKQAVFHVRRAHADRIWKAVQTQTIPEMPYTVDGIPPSVLSSWVEIKRSIRVLPEDRARGIMFPYRLSKLAEIVSARPLMSIPRLIEEGKAQEQEDALRLHIFQAQVASRKKAKGHKTADREAVKAHQSALATEAPARLRELERERELARERSFGEEATDAQTMVATIANASSVASTELLRKSALSRARILHSKSAKLNFILNEVAKYGQGDKFLIFSKSPLTLAHISDALTLARIKFISFTNDLKLETRQQAVTTFETSDTFRVFLMDLKLGSHGLNLVSASRVIFCEPVWHADVEAQAIKRVHRIGQKKPIIVKTLVMRGTPEELVVSRRTELKRMNQSQSLDSADDVGIRDFIERPRFLPDSEFKPQDVNISLLDLGDIDSQLEEFEDRQVPSLLDELKAATSSQHIDPLITQSTKSSGVSYYSDDHSRVEQIQAGRKHSREASSHEDETPPKKRRVMFA
ncbi:unnamed protein product [Peniophora sp. CBMAI 1063]|nr:unnamed protein product [Peniophora sp. CBMAI 1063]